MKKNTIFLIASGLLLLLGCAKEPAGSGEGIPMRVAASLLGDTKASLTTAGLTEFYLQLGCTDAAYAYFGKVSKSGTAWSASKQLSWKDETTPVSVCAAYFGGHTFTAAEFASGVDLAVPADQSTQAGLNGADLLTKPADSVKYEDTTEGELPVALNHGLAKVNFVITLGDAFNDAKIGLTDNPVKTFTVKGANTGFNFKPQSGAVTVTAATQADITPLAGTYTPSTATSKTATAVFEAILVPQSFAVGELSVTFSIGGGDYAWSNADAITLSVGKTYNLHVSVTTAVPVEYAYVDMGNGLKWATCNVGADNPEDYGDYFAWGETAPKAEYSWGTYQWMENGQSSRKHITKYTFADGQTSCIWYDGDTFKGDNGDGVEHKDFASYDYADDAARANWGGNWRTPTDAEWTWLRENCNWAWQTDYNGTGVKGMLVTSTINGNQIFLPAAGYRENANLFEADALGYYWSSSLYEFYSYYASYVYFSLGRVTRSGYFRFFGQSVRPVTGGNGAIDAEAITLTPVADYCDVYLGQDIQPRTSQCIGIGATQVFSVSVSPSGASQEVSIQSSSGEASFSLTGNTLTVSAPPSATSSTPTAANTSTVTLLGAGGYTQVFTFNITELDPYLAKSGDVITSEGHIGDGGNRGAGIFEDPVFTVDKVNCMIAHIGEEHLTEDPLWSSYKPNPGITGFGNREVHGIAVPINITKLHRTDMSAGELYYTDNSNDNFIEDSGNLPKWVKNNSEYKALLRSNSTKHSAFMNTCCHVYCNAGRGASYEILSFNYFVEDATKQPSIDAGEPHSLNPSYYLFCSSFSASGNGLNASSVNECSLLGPWVMPTIADFLSVFTDGLTASADFSDVEYTNEKKAVSKVEVLLHTLSLFGYSGLTYNDTLWWLANETGQNMFVRGTVSGNGASLKISKRVQHNTDRAYVLPIRYF